jgi:hypothetical protein
LERSLISCPERRLIKYREQWVDIEEVVVEENSKFCFLGEM